MTKIYRARIARVQKKLKETGGVLLLSSAPQCIRNRDTHYPYRQNSDFYYLTGSVERNLALFVSSTEKAPLLFAPKANPQRTVWEGNPEDPKKLARALGAELIVTENPAAEVIRRVKGSPALYYQSFPGNLSLIIAQELMSRPSHERSGMPSSFHPADTILTPMRVHKEEIEVETIRKAASITTAALEEALPYIAPNVPERFLQATIDYWFRVYGGEPAFTTIVGAGASAAALHYEQCTRIAKKSDLILIDCGAEYQYYASDITRVFPATGRFEGATGELYDIVLEAQKAAISKVRAGVKAQAVYDAAARVMSQGLCELRVLRGSASSHFNRKSFLPYFPHGIGHPLGLDVHDVGNLRGNNAATLEAGMVITVEPGLYFPKAAGKLPACGVRIEDDVLVTKKGCEVLTSFPKERAEVEELMMESQYDLI